MQHSTY